MRILCTNDDGYLALGLKVLTRAAASLGEVTLESIHHRRSQPLTVGEHDDTRPIDVTRGDVT